MESDDVPLTLSDLGDMDESPEDLIASLLGQAEEPQLRPPRRAGNAPVEMDIDAGLDSTDWMELMAELGQVSPRHPIAESLVQAPRKRASSYGSDSIPRPRSQSRSMRMSGSGHKLFIEMAKAKTISKTDSTKSPSGRRRKSTSFPRGVPGITQQVKQEPSSPRWTTSPVPSPSEPYASLLSPTVQQQLDQLHVASPPLAYHDLPKAEEVIFPGQHMAAQDPRAERQYVQQLRPPAPVVDQTQIGAEQALSPQMEGPDSPISPDAIVSRGRSNTHSGSFSSPLSGNVFSASDTGTPPSLSDLESQGDLTLDSFILSTQTVRSADPAVMQQHQQQQQQQQLHHHQQQQIQHHQQQLQRQQMMQRRRQQYRMHEQVHSRPYASSPDLFHRLEEVPPDILAASDALGLPRDLESLNRFNSHLSLVRPGDGSQYHFADAQKPQPASSAQPVHSSSQPSLERRSNFQSALLRQQLLSSMGNSQNCPAKRRHTLSIDGSMLQAYCDLQAGEELAHEEQHMKPPARPTASQKRPLKWTNVTEVVTRKYSGDEPSLRRKNVRVKKDPSSRQQKARQHQRDVEAFHVRTLQQVQAQAQAQPAHHQHMQHLLQQQLLQQKQKQQKQNSPRPIQPQPLSEPMLQQPRIPAPQVTEMTLWEDQRDLQTTARTRKPLLASARDAFQVNPVRRLAPNVGRERAASSPLPPPSLVAQEPQELLDAHGQDKMMGRWKCTKYSLT